MVKYLFITKPGRNLLGRIMPLYKSQGWWEKDDSPGRLKKMISGSHCFIIAVENGRVAGMGRAISDGANDAYIQDVAVAKSRSGKGIGSGIIKRLVRRLKKDGIKWIGLIAANRSHRFYERIGFKKMPDSDPMLLKK